MDTTHTDTHTDTPTYSHVVLMEECRQVALDIATALPRIAGHNATLGIGLGALALAIGAFIETEPLLARKGLREAVANIILAGEAL